MCKLHHEYVVRGRRGWCGAVVRRADQTSLFCSGPYELSHIMAEVYETHSDDHIFVLLRVPSPGFFTLSDVLRVPDGATPPAGAAPGGSAPRAAGLTNGGDDANASIAGATEEPTSSNPPPTAAHGPIVWKGACSRCGTTSLYTPAYLCLHWYGCVFNQTSCDGAQTDLQRPRAAISCAHRPARSKV